MSLREVHSQPRMVVPQLVNASIISVAYLLLLTYTNIVLWLQKLFWGCSNIFSILTERWLIFYHIAASERKWDLCKFVLAHLLPHKRARKCRSCLAPFKTVFFFSSTLMSIHHHPPGSGESMHGESIRFLP